MIEHALGVLDRFGLADLTMRRLGREIGVQPSAIYHHFDSKQALLAAVADEILQRGPTPPDLADAPWDEQVTAECLTLRAALLQYRDGAEVVATVAAFGLGGDRPRAAIVDALGAAGFDESLVEASASTFMHYVFGHTVDEQTHQQAASFGAISTAERDAASFEIGVGLIIDGLRTRLDAR